MSPNPNPNRRRLRARNYYTCKNVCLHWGSFLVGENNRYIYDNDNELFSSLDIPFNFSTCAGVYFSMSDNTIPEFTFVDVLSFVFENLSFSADDAGSCSGTSAACTFLYIFLQNMKHIDNSVSCLLLLSSVVLKKLIKSMSSEFSLKFDSTYLVDISLIDPDLGIFVSEYYHTSSCQHQGTSVLIFSKVRFSSGRLVTWSWNIYSAVVRRHCQYLVF